jgi:hypothetical protein
MHRLGIWVNVNVYLLVWTNAKSSIEHLFVFLWHQKKIYILVYVQMCELINNISYIYTFILCIQNLVHKAFEPIFAKELIFNLYMEHIFHGIKLCQIRTARWTKRNGAIKPFHYFFAVERVRKNNFE